MDLVDFLTASGWSKAELSRRIGVSKQAIGQWDQVPPKWVPVLQAVIDGEETPPAKPVPTDLEVLVQIRKRSKLGDMQCARNLGMKVYQFNKAIADLVAKYPLKDPFWKQVKSDSDSR